MDGVAEGAGQARRIAMMAVEVLENFRKRRVGETRQKRRRQFAAEDCEA